MSKKRGATDTLARGVAGIDPCPACGGPTEERQGDFGGAGEVVLVLLYCPACRRAWGKPEGGDAWNPAPAERVKEFVEEKA